MRSLAASLFVSLFLLLLIAPHAEASSARQKSRQDSLEVRLILVDDTTRLDILFELSDLLAGPQPERALQHADQAATLAERLNDRRLPEAHRRQARLVMHLLADYERALEYGYAALEAAKARKNKAAQVQSLLLIGEIFEEAGDQYKALQNYLEAETIAETLSSESLLVQIYNAIGRVNRELGERSRALDYHQKALETATQSGDREAQAQTAHLMGQLHVAMGDMGTALAHYQNSLALSKAATAPHLESANWYEMARIMQLQGMADSALSLHRKAYTIRNESPRDSLGLAASLNAIGRLQVQKGDLEPARYNLQRALAISTALNDKRQIRDSYNNLYAFHTALQEYQQALTYKDLYIAMSELIYAEESNRKITEMQARYDIAQKENEIKVLQQDREIQELTIAQQDAVQSRLFIALAAVAIIALLGFVLFRIKQKANSQLQESNEKISQQNEELQELNATKDKFFSIISHDMKGPLNSLTSFSGLIMNHGDALSKEEIKMLATDLDKSVKNLYRMLENLLDWARSQSGRIELKPEDFDVQEEIQKVADVLGPSAENKEIKLDTSQSNAIAVHGDRNTINTVIRNLVSNAIKFTLKDGTVSVITNEWADGVEVEVRDSGVGMPPEVLKKLFRIDEKHSTKGTNNEKGTGLGLILCKEFVEMNGGTIAVESTPGKGSTFRFTIPKGKG